MTGALGTNSQVLWYVARGSGIVDMVLLTVALALGVSQIVRWVPRGWPRFVLLGLHRNVSLLAVVLLAVHVATILLDTYVHIPIWAVVVPFVGRYHPLSLGLGAIALDLLVVLVVTSLVRDRIGQGLWRAVHWTAYACWPLAVAHGLALGTDAAVGWVDVLNGACVLVAVAAVGWRLTGRVGPTPPPVPSGRRPPRPVPSRSLR